MLILCCSYGYAEGKTPYTTTVTASAKKLGQVRCSGSLSPLRLKSDAPKLQLLTKKHLNFLPYAKLV